MFVHDVMCTNDNATARMAGQYMNVCSRTRFHVCRCYSEPKVPLVRMLNDVEEARACNASDPNLTKGGPSMGFGTLPHASNMD